MRETILVIGLDMICFPVDAETLEPLRCGCYDPWAWSDPLPGKRMGESEWQLQKNIKDGQIIMEAGGKWRFAFPVLAR